MPKIDFIPDTIDFTPDVDFTPEFIDTSIQDPSEAPGARGMPRPFGQEFAARMVSGAVRGMGIPFNKLARLQPGGAEAIEKVEALPWYKKGPEAAGFGAEKITEFVALKGLLTGARVLGGLPKGAGALAKAFETSKLFGALGLTEEARRAAIGEYEGGGGQRILIDMAFGAALSFATQGIGGIWSKLKPTEQKAALRLLGLKRGASAQQIRRAAQRLAQTTHPDKVAGKVEQFQKVMAARDVLLKGPAKDIVFRGKAPAGAKLLPEAPQRAPVAERPLARPTVPPKAPTAIVKPKTATEHFFTKEKPAAHIPLAERKTPTDTFRKISLEEYRERLLRQEGSQIRVLESQPDVPEELAKMAIIRAKLGEIKLAKTELEAAESFAKKFGITPPQVEEARQVVQEAESLGPTEGVKPKTEALKQKVTEKLAPKIAFKPTKGAPLVEVPDKIEPGYQSTSKSVNEHIGYFGDLQVPETSNVRPIQAEMKKVNGRRLAGTITTKEANKKIKALRKELFETAQAEGISLRSTKGGKMTLSVRQAGTFVPVEFSEYGKYKDIKPLFGGGQDITRAVQQMDGSLTVKQKLAVKGQAGPIERNVLWRTRDMSIQKIDFIKEQTIKLRKIVKARPNSAADIMVNNVLREIASGDTLEIAKASPSVRAITKNPKIIKEAVELRKWYDDIINDQNALRDMRNQEPIPFRKNYSPEILRDATIWERVMMKDTSPRTVTHGVELPDYIKPNKPFNPRELAREAGIKYEDRVKSAVQLARNYLVTASKDIYNTSIIQNNKAFIQQLEAMGYRGSAQYLSQWTAEAFAGVKPALTRNFQWPRWLEKKARQFNTARNIAVFPLNLSWNLTTQPSSLTFTFQKYGAWNTFRGFMDWMKPEVRKKAAQEYYSFIVKSTKHGRVTRQDVQNLIGETVAIKKTAGEQLYDVTTLLIHEMEKILTGTSIQAAHRFGVKRGLTGKALQEFASDGGAKTQSMYNDEDRPALLRNLGVKTLTPYQTFNFEAINNLREWAGKTGTPPSSQAERTIQLIRFIAAAAVFRMIAKKVANKDIWTTERIPIPFAEYWLTPLIKTWDKQYSGTPSLVSPVQVVNQLVKGIRDVKDSGSWSKLRKVLTTYGTGYLGIPGGVQINRVVEGLIAYSKGGVFDKNGRIMFKVDPDEWDDALIFGVYTTRGGREYLEKRKPKKKSNLFPTTDDAAERRLRQ